MDTQSFYLWYLIISEKCQSEHIENGILVYKGEFLGSSVSIGHGQQVMISCNNGYTISEKIEITCQLGKWSAPFPKCKPGKIIKIKMLSFFMMIYF